MAIQIAGTTVIDDNKFIQNIGGAGGFVAGSASVPASSARFLKLSGVRGISFCAAAFDPDDSAQTSGAYRISIHYPVRNSSSTSTRHSSANIVSGGNSNQSMIDYPFYYNEDTFAMKINNYYSVAKTVYYLFVYSGTGSPTVTIT